MNRILQGRIVVVTGAAGRIGQSFCHAIARSGGTAVVTDIDARAAENLAQEIRLAEGDNSAIAAELDITNSDAVDKLIKSLVARYGHIDALVNNAYPRHEGYGRRMEEVEFEHFCRNISGHIGGYFLCSQRFARQFGVQDRGNIVNIASIYGALAPRFDIYKDTGMTMPVEYAIIKSGIIQFTRYCAQYFKPHGIRVNAISPGGVEADQPEEFIRNYTEFTLGSRMLKPNDLDGALVFLLSDMSLHMTGQNLFVDDGWSL